MLFRSDRAVIAAAQALELPHDSAVIAVGGYGRGELFPYSDVDLLLLFDTPIDDALHRRISDFLGVCWDMGLEIGHSVRTVEECLAQASADGLLLITADQQLAAYPGPVRWMAAAG